MVPTIPSKTVEQGLRAPLIVWRIVDGRPGHDNQSRGLIGALARLTHTVCLDIPASALKYGLMNFILGKYPPGAGLKNPDLIIGAGHRTHISVLCARHACGGSSVVLMQPSLPTSWFDYCFIPDHDDPPTANNIIVTQGMINTIIPSTQHDPVKGLILIGGPSRHYDWDDAALLEQIETIINATPDINWVITDSRRTPLATSAALKNLTKSNIEYFSCDNTGPGWVAEQFAMAGNVWVSADSMSMLYEALTAGAATGVLAVPHKTANKISIAIDQLCNRKLLTRFEDWQTYKQLPLPDTSFYEAGRCAETLLTLTGHKPSL